MSMFNDGLMCHMLKWLSCILQLHMWYRLNHYLGIVAGVAYLVLVKMTLMYACMHIYCCVQMNWIYITCACLYIDMWCTLVSYIQYANWLYYIHESGNTIWCITVTLVQMQHLPPSYSKILWYMPIKCMECLYLFCVILLLYMYALHMIINLDCKLLVC